MERKKETSGSYTYIWKRYIRYAAILILGIFIIIYINYFCTSRDNLNKIINSVQLANSVDKIRALYPQIKHIYDSEIHKNNPDIFRIINLGIASSISKNAFGIQQKAHMYFVLSMIKNKDVKRAKLAIFPPVEANSSTVNNYTILYKKVISMYTKARECALSYNYSQWGYTLKNLIESIEKSKNFYNWIDVYSALTFEVAYIDSFEREYLRLGRFIFNSIPHNTPYYVYYKNRLKSYIDKKAIEEEMFEHNINFADKYIYGGEWKIIDMPNSCKIVRQANPMVKDGIIMFKHNLSYNPIPCLISCKMRARYPVNISQNEREKAGFGIGVWRTKDKRKNILPKDNIRNNSDIKWSYVFLGIKGGKNSIGYSSWASVQIRIRRENNKIIIEARVSKEGKINNNQDWQILNNGETSNLYSNICGIFMTCYKVVCDFRDIEFIPLGR